MADGFVSMKVYDLQWHTTFGLDYAEAAEALKADGVDTVLTQNRTDPLPGSGVDQAAYLAVPGVAERLAAYDDGVWVAALRAAGLRIFQTTALFFEPAALARFPDARPVDARGQPDQGIDWYVGICPTHEGHLLDKIARLRQVVAELAPDGLFLQFTRYPGFWENWTWAPDYVFTDADRFCFCDRCRSRFAAETGFDLPKGDVPTQSRFILERHGDAWTAWRCARIVDAVERIAAAANEIRPGTRIMLNTLPFPANDFDGLDVRREVAAQDLTALARTVERFELMTYLQILNRPADWLAEAVADARRQLPAEREVVCTLQLAPLYTEGVHAGRGRASDVSADDLATWIGAARGAGVDGLVFYHWTDLLEDAARGGRKREVIRALVNG
jgi:hypothetical protein